MKKKLLGILAVFALVVTGIFGFVGCKNKEETKGLTEADVVGTYNATTVTISGGYEGFRGEHTFTEYVALSDEGMENYLKVFLADFFGETGVYKLKNDEGTRTITLDDEPVATWEIENNSIKATPTIDAGSASGTTTYNLTVETNGNLTVNITYTDNTNPEDSFTAVLILVKQ